MSNQQSADPMVFVGPVDELQTVIPVLIALPCMPKSRAKFEEAGTAKITTGTAVSAGKDAVL